MHKKSNAVYRVGLFFRKIVAKPKDTLPVGEAAGSEKERGPRRQPEARHEKLAAGESRLEEAQSLA